MSHKSRMCPDFFIGVVLVLVLIMALCGCASHNGTVTGESQSYHPERGPAPKVAPLFIHGEGKGARGCFASFQSYFLPESLARLIIVDELEAGGLVVDSFDMAIESIRIYRWRSCCFLGLEPSARQPRLLLDGYCEEDNIGFEYISFDDYYQLGGRFNRSTYQEMNMLQIARGVRETLRKHGRISAAVFYDPVVETDVDEWVAFWVPESDVIERSADQLRLQVRDFLIWLEGEGLILRKR